MPPIGETLREARMRQKLDIADVEERTKIRAKYLRALENEEWGLLPGPTFVRTFLRTYAEVVGIDPHVLVEEYRTQHEPREEYDFQPLAPTPPRGGRGGRRQPARQAPGPPRRGAIVAAIVVAVVAFLIALGLLGGDDEQPADSAKPTPGATDTARAKRSTPKPKRESPRPAPTGVAVRIAPLEPTYVCVDSGSGTDVVYEGTLDASRTFHDPKLLRLNLGKRSATVTLNGRRVQIAESAEPLGLALSKSGAEEIPAEQSPCV